MEDIKLENNVILVEKEELKDALDLYENEKAYQVEKDNEIKGTITVWSNGTMSYFDNEKNKDIDIKELEEVAKFFEE